MYAKVKDLPEPLRAALAAVGYGKQGVEVEARESTSIQCAGAAGRRGFAVLVNLGTGERDVRWGSYGGANMFNRDNPVDLDGKSYEIPANGAVVLGMSGNTVTPCHARIVVRPETMQPLLPAGPELTEEEHAVIAMLAGFNSAGRKRQVEDWSRAAADTLPDSFGEEYERAARATQAAIDAAVVKLVDKRLVNKNKAGALSLTVEGQNVRRSKPGVMDPALAYRKPFPGWEKYL